ncbi:NAD(P)-dependent oxidoreductase [soil metagenome]
MTSIGIIGLGIIGSRAAATLSSAGVEVYVWSPTPRPVANFLASPAEMASLTKVIQLFVRDSEALVETVEAVRDQLTHEHVVINSATVSPSATRKAASIVQGAAASFLDAPFTGSKDAAAAGELTYYVGGNVDILAEVRSLLEITSKAILHVGEIGHATVLKLATNMITASTIEILAEALALTRSQGIAPEKLAAAIALNACSSAAATMKLPAMINRSYEPHFSTKNMLKDTGYALEMAATTKPPLDLPVLAQVASILRETADSGHADDDFASLAQRYAK